MSKRKGNTPPPHHSLYGCELKIRRAREHLDVLQDALQEFKRRDPYEVTCEADTKADQYIVRLKVRERPPPEWSPLIGDIVHNARSALDHLAYQLVRKNGRSPTNNTAFPVFTEDPFDVNAHPTVLAAGKALERWGRQTDRMDPDDIALIKIVQPYKSDDDPGFHPLAILNNLSNWDKHRELTFATQSVAEVRSRIGPATRNATAKVVYTRPRGKVFEDEAIVARLVSIATGGPDPHVHAHLDIAYEVAFGKGNRLEGLGVRETLFDIGNYITDVFNRFRIRFDEQV